MTTSTDSSSDNASTELTADRPIESRHHDRLGRTPFARHLAKAIAKWKENDSLVIALYGEWGIGKSSIKNLALEQLRATNDVAPDVVQFNPWHWTGHEELSAAFFRDVLAVLETGESTKDTQEVIRTIRRYAAYLGLIKVFLGGPKGLIVVVLGIFGALAIAPPLILTEEHAIIFGKTLGVTALALAALIFWGQQTLEKLAVWLDLTGPGARSLEDRKKDVITVLKRYERTVLVVIDDIDRLTAKEIQAVFQLIKANADFPKFVYLVMFQRSTVERALGDLTKESGAEFLEKIVQVGFDVPQARQVEIDQILFEGLERVLGVRGSARVDQTYWGNIYFGSLRRYFRDLRDVKRFLATFEFHINLLRTNESLEVNPVDLIAVEALRIFEPDLYRILRDAKSLLTELQPSGTTDRTQIDKDVKALLSGVSSDKTDTLKLLIRNLFPPAAFAFGGSSYSSEFHTEWDRDLRICAPSFFDRYFQLGLSSGEVSQYELELLLAASSDIATFTRELERLSGEGRLDSALDRLDVNKEKIQSSDAVTALTALFDIGERLPESRPGAFLGPEWTIGRIAHHVLKRESEGNRIVNLKAILNGTSGLRIPIMFIGTNTNPEDRQKRPDNVLIPESELAAIQEIGLDKIRKAASEGWLINQRDLAYVLFRWRNWAGDTEAQQWSRNIAGSPEGALAFLRAFLHKGTSQTVGDQVAKINYFMKYSEIEHFADVYAIEEQIDRLPEVRLTDLDRKVVQEFRKAVTRKRSGKPEGNVGWDDDQKS